jgi:L-amino acid N-acyltransferase YncA
MTVAVESGMILAMKTRGSVRPARPDDCAAIASIYNEGIAERRSTFETASRTSADIRDWLSPGLPVLVAERTGGVVGWARIARYSPRPCYAGVGEASIYVRGTERGRGLGTALAGVLRREAEQTGFHKIVGKLFVDNAPSRRLVARSGFREVGVHLRHGQIDGEWRDVLVVELLLGEALADTRSR